MRNSFRQTSMPSGAMGVFHCHQEQYMESTEERWDTHPTHEYVTLVRDFTTAMKR